MKRTLFRDHLLLYVLVTLCCLIEAACLLADFGMIEPQRLRFWAYEHGGFWPGLLTNWKPNYAAQPYAMFFTYGFLHSGPLHLAVNMITLWSLGRQVSDWVGQGSFALLYGGSCLGGAVGFALLAPDLRPMVGASGALFGLAGGLLTWGSIDRYTHGEHLWPVARAATILAGLNLVLWWAMDGQLAWEAHLGGFVAGVLLALIIHARPIEEG